MYLACSKAGELDENLMPKVAATEESTVKKEKVEVKREPAEDVD